MNALSNPTNVLDCTLRDGGYYTHWEFDRDFVNEYLDVIARSPVNDVELGYRSPEKDRYFGRYFYLSRADLLAAKQRLRPNQRLAIMFNLKDIEAHSIGQFLGDIKGIVDLIRFAVAPGEIRRALLVHGQVVAHGFACGLNIMHLSKWSQDVEQVLAPFKEVTDLDCLGLVDSYGGCFPDEVSAAVSKTCTLFSGVVGFHGHDNAGLAFANALSALQAGATSVDATFMGMGRGAGNLKTELMLTYVGIATGMEIPYFELSQFLDKMRKLHSIHQWGTSLPYMYSSLSGQEQGKVMDWLIKDRFDPAVVMGALQDKLVVHDGSDALTFTQLADYPANINGKRFILIGGGDSAEAAAAAIGRLEQRDTVILHTSLKSIDYFYDLHRHLIALSGHETQKVTPAKTAELARAITCWVVSTPPRFSGSVPGSGVVCQVNPAALFSVATIADVSVPSPLQLGLAAALECGAKEVMLIGFDGYLESGEAAHAKNEENAATLAEFFAVANAPKLVSLAPTLYRVPVRSLHAMVQGR
jgi:4-hydroxy 2-oxovalerate aldolase